LFLYPSSRLPTLLVIARRNDEVISTFNAQVNVMLSFPNKLGTGDWGSKNVSFNIRT